MNPEHSHGHTCRTRCTNLIYMELNMVAVNYIGEMHHGAIEDKLCIEGGLRIVGACEMQSFMWCKYL